MSTQFFGLKPKHYAPDTQGLTSIYISLLENQIKPNLKMREEVLVAALEDVELGVVKFGILVHGAVLLSDETAHSGAAFRGELAVEDDDDSFVWAGWDNRVLEEEVLHLVLLV